MFVTGVPDFPLSLAVALPGVMFLDEGAFLVPEGMSLVEVGGSCLEDTVEPLGCFVNATVGAGLGTTFVAGGFGSLVATGGFVIGAFGAVTVLGGLLFFGSTFSPTFLGCSPLAVLLTAMGFF